MTTEVPQPETSRILPKFDWESFLVPSTHQREQALIRHRLVVNEIYQDTKRLIEISGDTETTHLFRILGDIANLTIRHSSENIARAMEPAEFSLRYLRACKPKQYVKIRNLQKTRNGRDLNNILMDLGPDPNWIAAKRVIKSP